MHGHTIEWNAAVASNQSVLKMGYCVEILREIKHEELKRENVSEKREVEEKDTTKKEVKGD